MPLSHQFAGNPKHIDIYQLEFTAKYEWNEWTGSPERIYVNTAYDLELIMQKIHRVSLMVSNEQQFTPDFSDAIDACDREPRFTPLIGYMPEEDYKFCSIDVVRITYWDKYGRPYNVRWSET